MSFSDLALPAVILVTLTSLILLVSPDWRYSIVALAIQYLGVFILVAMAWPLQMAATKLVAGWMAGAVLGMAMLGLPHPEGARTDRWLIPSPHLGVTNLSGQIFRGFGAVLVLLLVFSLSPQLQAMVKGITLEQTWGGFILITMGLLQLGFTAQPLATILALQTTLAGFDIFYAAVESSTLVAGLLAGVHLGLAMVGAYLVVAPTMEESE